MRSNEPNVSDDAVRDATGKSWQQWRDFLDRYGASDLSHKEIVALAAEKGGVTSQWWQQAVANGYERLIGLRAKGQGADATFQTSVQRTVPLSPDAAWRLVTSPDGMRAWFGRGTLKLKPDVAYELRDGTKGEVRVVKPGSHLRLSWQPKGWKQPSVIQVRVIPKDDERSTISFHEENLPGIDAREQRRSHFLAALDALELMAGRVAGA